MSGDASVPRPGWEPNARQLGFTFSSAGPALHRLGMSLESEQGWAVLQIEKTHGEEAARVGELGCPGLWKGNGNGSLEFDLPPEVSPEQSHEAEGLALLVDWAVATAAGRVPGGWEPPAEDEVLGWAPNGSLFLSDAPLRVRGQLTREPQRLALAFPRVASFPDSLAPARRAWAGRILSEAQRRWRMVRIGEDSGSVCAEVDLSGVPEGFAEPLFGIALAALRAAVRSVLRPLTFALDLSVESALLDSPPPAAAGRRKDS